MSDATPASWPEQDAVDAWCDKYGIVLVHGVRMELQQAVTAYRIKIQCKNETLTADLATAQAEVEKLKSDIIYVECDRDIYEEQWRIEKARADALEEALVGAAATVGRCHAGKDGDCNWAGCPQMHDGEPKKSGRHCPLDNSNDHEDQAEAEADEVRASLTPKAT